MAIVRLDNLGKRYGGQAEPSVRGVTLTIADGEFMVLLGPSGCGKSTALRMIAGLEPISSGTVAIDGRIVNDVPAKDRDIAMVFQSYALYPHMTVRENLAFGLRRRRMAKAEIDRRVASAAERLGLTPFLARKPHALSGGQRQRVALGRAIVRSPKVFLFDEPLSNLDAALRVTTRNELIRQQHELGTTTIYVTHDQVEAMTMGDRICIMNRGETVQIGKRSNPAETVTQHIYELPKHLKLPLLSHLLKDDALQMVLVFSRTKHGADKIARKLEQTGVKCATLHANRSQNQRLKALDDFKAGRVRVLVATDIAARGIDVDGISHVINFDFPHVVEDYVHRIGRTGRAQAIGDAISFVSSDEMDDLRKLERFIGRGITRKRAENFDYKASPQSLDQEPDRSERRHQHQQRRPQNQQQQRHPGQRRHADRPKSPQGPNQGGQPQGRSGGGQSTSRSSGGQPQSRSGGGQSQGRPGGEQPKAAPAKRKSFWGRLTGR